MNILKKNILVFLFIIFLSANIFAISKFQANQISKDYVFGNEYVDGTTNKIGCGDSEFFVSTIYNYNSEMILFIVLDKEGNLYQGDDLSNIIETTYVLKKIRKDSKSNYLSLQLVDKIQNLIDILQASNAKLEGVISSDHSDSITSKTIDAKEELDDLINALEDLKENISIAYNKQQDFINNTSCEKTKPLISSLNHAFKGYNELTNKGLDYKNSANSIIEVIVANEDLSESGKNIIINYITPVSNLSQQLNTIYDSISKTNSFYNPIISKILKTEDTYSKQLIENLETRKNRVLVNDLFYTYDSTFDSTLKNTIEYILSEDLYSRWENQEDLEELEQNYKEINSLLSDNKYSLVLPKVQLASLQAEKVLNNGFKEQQVEYDYTNYYIIIAIAIILIIILLVLNKKSKKGKSKKSTKKNSSDSNNILKNRDPFK